MKRAIRASVLIMVLAIPAFAGEIPYGITSTPPADTTTQQGEIPNNVAGEIPYGVTSSSDPTTTEVVLNLLVQLIA
jgi:hypothetical protein